MSFYKKAAEFGMKFFPKHKLYRYGFNWSPMYRRSTAKVIHVSEDLLEVDIRIPISYKNRNYANSIFGGSMFSAVDPIPMVQLINILGNDYIVWDKSAEINFKRPALENLFAEFRFSKTEIEKIKENVKDKGEVFISKKIDLTSQDKSKVFCEVEKVVYIADKQFYKNKVKSKK